MNLITFPEYAEWVHSDMWRDCLNNHGHSWDGPRHRREDCPGCVAGMWLGAIHERLFESNETFETIWSLQDGYGVPGLTPPQGYDWSGIRDSSPAAIRRMAEALGLT